MDDYIKRSDAIEETRKPWTTRAELRRRICNIPPAVKEGEWIADKFQYLNCSECGCDTNLYDQHGFPVGQRKGHPYPSFCPHCGAKMGGKSDG